MNHLVNADFRPQWKEVESARSICQKALEKKEYPLDIVDAVTMITGELVENAVKYGDFLTVKDHITLSILTGKKVIVEVKCPIIKSKNQHFSRLDRTIQWIRAHQNPFEAYIEKLKTVSTKLETDKESGLGLFRIAYEGMAILDFYVADNGIISVSAVYQLEEIRGENNFE